MNKSIHVINGPNLNLLGVREPAIYGTTTLAEIQSRCEKRARDGGFSVSFFQSNHEGELVDLIQAARGDAGAIVINAAGYSFYSVAILDALKTFDGPIVEVHISNIHQRDKFHRHSILSTVATGVICGLGPHGYLSAIDAIISKPARQED